MIAQAHQTATAVTLTGFDELCLIICAIALLALVLYTSTLVKRITILNNNMMAVAQAQQARDLARLAKEQE